MWDTTGKGLADGAVAPNALVGSVSEKEPDPFQGVPGHPGPTLEAGEKYLMSSSIKCHGQAHQALSTADEVIRAPTTSWHYALTEKDPGHHQQTGSPVLASLLTTLLRR